MSTIADITAILERLVVGASRETVRDLDRVARLAQHQSESLVIERAQRHFYEESLKWGHPYRDFYDAPALNRDHCYRAALSDTAARGEVREQTMTVASEVLGRTVHSDLLNYLRQNLRRELLDSFVDADDFPAQIARIDRWVEEEEDATADSAVGYPCRILRARAYLRPEVK